jgi:hypothetical protein
MPKNCGRIHLQEIQNIKPIFKAPIFKAKREATWQLSPKQAEVIQLNADFSAAWHWRSS